MNRILFEPEEIAPDGTVTLAGDERASHILRVLGAKPGQVLRTGTINGRAGTSLVLEADERAVRLRAEHSQELPEPWLDLLLAAPRPKALKRLWPQLAALGVGRVVVINAAKVEKCYFSSQWLDPRHVRPLLVEGLMQAGTTRLPDVLVRPRFKPFVEDELDELFSGQSKLLAHPGPRTERLDGEALGRRPVLAVGPEGGWTEYELRMLRGRGFAPFSLGGRTLRTDTACVALVSVLGYMMEK